MVSQKADPTKSRQQLADLEQKLFDGVLAISCALENGIVNGVLFGCGDDHAFVEIIFPPRAGSSPGEENPSKALKCATPVACVASAGAVLHELILREHSQGDGGFQGYLDTLQKHHSMRKQLILKPIILGQN